MTDELKPYKIDQNPQPLTDGQRAIRDAIPLREPGPIGNRRAQPEKNDCGEAGHEEGRCGNASCSRWRDHVEQRLLTWRQSKMNRSGDRLALDDFMDKESLADLIDFVCDEWAEPAAHPPRAPLTDAELKAIWDKHGYKSAMCKPFARAIEAAHGIGAAQ